MDNQKDLLKYLASLGFEGPMLESDIAKLFEQFPPTGTVYHVINYGAEQMRVALNLEHDRQFNAYRLASYKAIYRKPVKIDTETFKGVDIAALEQLMASVNWRNWFSVRENSEDAIAAESVHRQLDILAADYNPDGMILRDLLRYKYFPAEALDARVLRNMAFEFENERTFHSGATGIVNANLAFHILNGNLDRLHESLLKTELDRFIEVDIHSLLCAFLSSNPAAFSLECAKPTEEGLIAFSISVRLDAGRYEPGTNTVTLERPETILHKRIAHVDTGVLEQEMAGIDWKSDDLYELSQENVKLSAAIERIDRTLAFLERTNTGEIIAGQLKRKYWSGAPFFESFVPPKEHATEKIVAEFPLDFPAKSIFNLLCGRPVIARPLSTLDAGFNEWLRVTDVAGTTPNIVTVENGLSRADLAHLVTALCVKEPEYEVINGLLQGDHVQVSARTIAGYVSVQLEAMPEQRDLKLFSNDGQPIPMNFHLDANWKQPLTRPIAKQHLSTKQKRTPPKGKRL